MAILGMNQTGPTIITTRQNLPQGFATTNKIKTKKRNNILDFVGTLLFHTKLSIIARYHNKSVALCNNTPRQGEGADSFHRGSIPSRYSTQPQENLLIFYNRHATLMLQIKSVHVWRV
jgi:hypothetical protein